MIGLLPCAGTAARIHGLPKFLLPVPGGYLLERHIRGMRAAGCSRVLIGTRPDNDELVYDYADGADCRIAEQRETMTQTVLSMRHYIYDADEPVLFSMPDTYMGSSLATYMPLQLALVFRADVAVALFKARPNQYTQGGMCRVEGNRVAEVVDKPEKLPFGFDYIWGALAWKPKFWEYLDPADPHVGYGLPRAIAAGLDVRAVVYEGNYWDMGTNARYFECIRSLEGVTDVQSSPVAGY